MLRALLIGSLLVVPAKLAFACDDDDDSAGEDNDNNDGDTEEAETPDPPEAPEIADNGLEARVDALEARVEALEQACSDDGGPSFDFDIEID